MTTLYNGEMGGCFVPTATTISGVTSAPNILPRSTSTTVPTATYSLTFGPSSPCPTGTTCSYGWEATSPTDSSTLAALHTGILTLNGATQWVDLNAVSGATSVSSTVFPTVGGGSGWSFELTIKLGPLELWGKIFDFGATRAVGGGCQHDIVLGWDAGNNQFQFDTCDSTGHEFQTGDCVWHDPAGSVVSHGGRHYTHV